ncbi:MAG: hypothetical protein JO165_09515 [Candidatus Eremiobacteraeota bacterium]|nr:hypothetical protein [Candidatus Eremiobacteraeota bacterium]
MRSRVFSVSALAASVALASCHGGAGVNPIPTTDTPATQSVAQQTAVVSSPTRIDSSITAINLQAGTTKTERFATAIAPPEAADQTASADSPAMTALPDGGRGHIMPQKGAPSTLSTYSVPKLLYRGGPIQKSPKKVLVLWGFGTCGSSGCSNDPDKTFNYLYYFLSGIGGSGYENLITQYYSTAQGHITNPAAALVGNSAWVDNNPAPTHPTDAQVQAQVKYIEAYLQSHHYVTGINKDINYVVALGYHHDPSGFKPGGFCAYHSFYGGTAAGQAYTNFPYVMEIYSLCGGDQVYNAYDAVTGVLSHEVAEAATDPTGQAWWAADGEEIGDKCNAQDRAATLHNGYSFAVQLLFSNASDSCAL